MTSGTAGRLTEAEQVGHENRYPDSLPRSAVTTMSVTPNSTSPHSGHRARILVIALPFTP